MTTVELQHLSKQFGEVTAVSQVSLNAPDGQITALLGPSGCGKTTILKTIAGLLAPSAGDVLFNGRSVLNIPAEKRNAVMVFQNHLLFPYLSVGENVGFGLKMRGVDAATIRQKVDEHLALVQLPGLAKRRPNELSGGQQQRVALARALIVEPTVLLLDEPLSNLDAHLREEMRQLIRTLQRSLNMTTIVVTHDQEEAVLLADQIGLMFDSKLAQVGPPSDFYERPSTRQVASFFGATNFLAGEKCGNRVKTAVGPLHVAPNAVPDGPVQLTIRPEHVQLAPADGRLPNQLCATVQEAIYAGTHTRLRLTLDGDIELTLITAPAAAKTVGVGTAVHLHLPPEHLWPLP